MPRLPMHSTPPLASHPRCCKCGSACSQLWSSPSSSTPSRRPTRSTPMPPSGSTLAASSRCSGCLLRRLTARTGTFSPPSPRCTSSSSPSSATRRASPTRRPFAQRANAAHPSPRPSPARRPYRSSHLRPVAPIDPPIARHRPRPCRLSAPPTRPRSPVRPQAYDSLVNLTLAGLPLARSGLRLTMATNAAVLVAAAGVAPPPRAKSD